MAHNTYSHVSTIRRVELVRSHFEWNGQIEKKVRMNIQHQCESLQLRA